MNTRMPESCVDVNRCGTYYTLWLNGPHPQIEDGVVTRQVCGNTGYDCYYFRTTTIQVKACPGNYYVYELIRPDYCNMAYCTDGSYITPTSAPAIPVTPEDFSMSTDSLTSSMFDPCDHYNVLDEYWRSTKSYYTGHDDTIVEWNGWYRLFLQGASAQMPEWCVSYMTCGGYTPLALGGAHPQVQDGIVIREVYGSSGSQCTAYRSNSIQVKACPGNYYVYKLVRPDVSVPMPSYCAVTVNHPSFDPCNTYTALDQPWRASNETGLNICDHYYLNWNGWYRLFSHGMNTRMPESCVDVYRCGTYYTLWLNGPHPQIEDGVVTRQVCGNTGYDCYYFRTTTIQVKACPGNYYVYELVRPDYCNMAYYGSYITPTSAPAMTVTPEDFSISANFTTDYSFDPCENYTSLNDEWRTTQNYYGYNSHDDTLVEWSGWYRLYLHGNSAQLPEWCSNYMACGGYTPLLLSGSHPRLQDGIVTREIYGSSGDQCKYYRSNSIQVKACPGQYYVYELVTPDVSIPIPTYCAVSFSISSYDPCTNYTSLDQPWRANNATGLDIYDSSFNWNGWYRLFYYGMNIHMAESCVSTYRCGSYYTLWLNGAHPQIEDGVVARQVCGNTGSSCCHFGFHAIQVKACPGNYYIYQLTDPKDSYNNYNYYNTYYYHNYYYNPMAYCTDASSITPIQTTVTTGNESSITMTPSPYEYNFDPCYNHTVLNEDWRNIHYSYTGHDDTTVEWDGWYRFYLQGRSAQISEGCVSYRKCGGYTPLVLGGSHPREQDGIVTRSVLAFSGTNCNSASQSKPIQVKACPGHYYVYKLVRPDVSNIMPTYCAVAYNFPSTDPCDNYNVLDQSWRATDNADRNYNYYYWWWWYTWCDSYTYWNGWYRLLYHSNNTRMPESCVNQGMCGTDIPLWLNGPHPRLEDGVVSRQVCGSWGGDCCYFKSFPIQVKACPGNYYVYEFVSPAICSSAYCADVAHITMTEAPTTAMVDPCKELNCTADEWCGESNGVYGCFCNENHPRPGNDSYDSKEECESSSGTMSLSRCQLFEAGFSADLLHLSDPNCTGTIQNGRVVFHFNNDDHICGTSLTANGTHFIYENTIQGGAESGGGPIHRKKYLELQFSCIYQISQTLSMDTELTPLQSVVHKNLPNGQGMYQVRIVPYQDAALSQPYNGSVKIVVDERIYVGVFVQGVDSRQIATVIDSCWATPERDQHHAVRWDLITNRCPNSADKTVEVLQNGVSTTGLFSFKMFAFNGNYQKVFLHCSIYLCLLQNNNCAADCVPGFHPRVGRSVNNHDLASISVGPFIWTT
ncbi:uncharacterized protein LOC111190549 [Astyanax mexicanus]|uniref:uncharacterized protein LOC111190549 n=1 Tax=Astyanax mexicanus TaxID=7994 RepID=UPI0020CB3FF2|nr:uncharacterized protein LOC111190549 [Astyanax mexicanus]